MCALSMKNNCMIHATVKYWKIAFNILIYGNNNNNNNNRCLYNHVRGRVKKSLQPSFFSSHGCIYTKVAVSTSSMNLCLSWHVTWRVLFAWLHYGISIKTMHFGHCLLSQIGGNFELRENHVVAF